MGKCASEIAIELKNVIGYSDTTLGIDHFARMAEYAKNNPGMYVTASKPLIKLIQKDGQVFLREGKSIQISPIGKKPVGSYFVVGRRRQYDRDLRDIPLKLVY